MLLFLPRYSVMTCRNDYIRLKIAIIAVCVCFFPTFAIAASDADKQFERIAKDFLTDLPEFSAVNAMYIGDHRLDVNMSGNAICGLMARDFAPIEERLNNAAARLEQMPRFFDPNENVL